MPAPLNANDPRVKRTRQLLYQALFSLLAEKSFPSISVQDIAERATLNRATFYAHFVDKYDLIDSMMRDQFRQTLERAVPADVPFSIDSLRTLSLTVLSFLANLEGHCKPADRQFDPMLEKAVQEVLSAFILRWLSQLPHAAENCSGSRETLAAMMSWGIFGVAAQWSRGDRAQSADQIATQIVEVLSRGMTASLGTATPALTR